MRAQLPAISACAIHTLKIPTSLRARRQVEQHELLSRQEGEPGAGAGQNQGGKWVAVEDKDAQERGYKHGGGQEQGTVDSGARNEDRNDPDDLNRDGRIAEPLSKPDPVVDCYQRRHGSQFRNGRRSEGKGNDSSECVDEVSA